MMMRLVLCLVACSLIDAAHVRWDAPGQSYTEEDQCPLKQCMEAVTSDLNINWAGVPVTQEMVERCRREVHARHNCLQSALQNNQADVCAACMGSLTPEVLDAINANPQTLTNQCPQSCDVNNEEHRQCLLLCKGVVQSYYANLLQEQDMVRIRQCDTCSSSLVSSCPHSNFLFHPAGVIFRELWIHKYMNQANRKGCPIGEVYVTCRRQTYVQDYPHPCNSDASEEVVAVLAECWRQNLQQYPQCINPGRYVQLEVDFIRAVNAGNCQAMQQRQEIRKRCGAEK